MDVALLVSNILAVCVLVSGDVKTWTPNTNYNNPSNWDSKSVPCSADRAIFPADTRFSVLLPGGSSAVRELVLPLSGETIMSLNGELAFTGANTLDTNCPHPRDVTFSRTRPAQWLLPGNWRSAEMVEDNPAVPHLYRLPCQQDSVVFPQDSSFSVKLPQQSVYVRQISIHGQDVNLEDWSDFLMTDTGEIQFLAPEDTRLNAVAVTGVTSCDDPAGCTCMSEEAQQEMCSIQGPLCGASPPCVSPVRPIGHCCDVCGAYVLVDYNDNFKLSDLRDLLGNMLKNGELSSRLVSHVGKTTENDKIQVVLMDIRDYSSTPGEAARKLAAILKNRKESLGVISIEVFISGAARYADGVARIFGDIFGPLLGVLATFGLLYLVFVVYGDKQLFSLYDITLGGGSFMFARFDNTPGEGGDDETALEAAEEAAHVEVVTVGGRAAPPQNAFDNPMFGQQSSSSSKSKDRRRAKLEKQSFMELKDKHSSGSEDTVEEDLVSSQDEEDHHDIIDLTK